MSEQPDAQEERMAKVLAFVEASCPDLELHEWQRQFVLNMPEEMPDLHVDKRSRMFTAFQKREVQS